ncbi:hypothetical protein E1258_19095 [Micromonospora sp. KC207]|uniref:hypothetical protein n=1 Tax=unclassified Micromonospora TaxID=2617518 RepID=UPI001051D5B7|nr:MULTISPECIES: hypothetical protein [unclassified Micromonospora]TDB75430.1 hypothetical protein E1165_11195 [Micromonospora sp. KC723]TDC59130.1 hypothetical protein E1258_19095 [Micromonospora sp. KC207]
MAHSSPDTGARSEEILAAAGIVVDDQGKARARRKLDEAQRRWTPELDAELRAQIGLPARAA